MNMNIKMKKNLKRGATVLGCLFAVGLMQAQTVSDSTFCNPLNLNYRFTISGSGYREAADPEVVYYEGCYYLFASVSGGYWYSTDFKNWTFVTPTGLDIEKYAPAVWVIGKTMYYTSSSSGDIYKTDDPKKGVWTYVSHPHDWNDPWVFVDDDGKVYCYHGSGENGTIDCAQLDPNNKFAVINHVTCIESNTEQNGYELNGDDNTAGYPWTEGSALFKYKGKYYLTYGTPGTERRSYCDGYYMADSPMGPFTLAPNSPLVRKSTGFVTGTGHGGLFTDVNGHLWTIDCTLIGLKHMFERRISIFPVFYDEATGMLHANTVCGDYPMYYPGTFKETDADYSAHLNLLSKGKQIEVSSRLAGCAGKKAADDDIKTYWSAKTGNVGEWIKMDLGSVSTVKAIQANFYESNTAYHEGRKDTFSIKYLVEGSTDGENWTVIEDRSNQTKDAPADYIEFKEAKRVRYIRVTNKGSMPGNGCFALSDLRVFGYGNDATPEATSTIIATRNTDRRQAVITWNAVSNAKGYIVRYGIAADKLWNHYQVNDATTLQINSLVTTCDYFYRVDTYNENGMTIGKTVVADGTTGISTIHTNSANENANASISANAIYSLRGENMGENKDTLPEGLFVSNNKKFIVK